MYDNLFIPQLFLCNYFCISLASHGWRGRATDHQQHTQQNPRPQGDGKGATG